jgi:SAM-dependent methyltransferase
VNHPQQGHEPEVCEACDSRVTTWRLDSVNVLQRCTTCGHLGRKLADCPAQHRSAMYGGDPGLDAVRLRLTYRLLKAAAPAVRSVFEVGFGTGALLQRFRSAGVTVAGADPGHLDRPVHPALAGEPGIHRLPLGEVPAGSVYDLVYAVHVIEHVTDAAAFLAAAQGLVRPGGTLALLTPAGDTEVLRLLGSSWWMLEDPTHIRFFTPRSARGMVERAGFHDVRVSRPILDSAATEVASLVRRRSQRGTDRGVLSRPAVLAAAAAAFPVTLAARVVRPRLRASLLIVASKADGAR